MATIRLLAVYEYTPKNAAQIHNEIVQYGYVYNDAFLHSVDLTNGTDFVFIQVSDCEIVMTAPAVIVAEMKSRIMSGLRVWNNPDNFLNYGTEQKAGFYQFAAADRGQTKHNKNGAILAERRQNNGHEMCGARIILRIRQSGGILPPLA